MKIPKYQIVYADNNEPVFPMALVTRMVWDDSGNVSMIGNHVNLYYLHADGLYTSPSSDIKVKLKQL